MKKIIRPFDQANAALQHIQTEECPKGELWLGTDILKAAGFEDTLFGHIHLIERLGHHTLCLPVAHEPFMNTVLGYRYFSVEDVRNALKKTDLFVMAVIDGPFQRLVEQRGLMKILTGWIRQKDEVLAAYENEGDRAEDLLNRCLDYPVHGIVIADDLAGDRAPFLSPREIERFSSRFYDHWVSRIHAARAAALFHSCGNIGTIIPQLLSAGFDGLASVQHRTNDLVALKALYGPRLTVMGGIDGDLLEKESLSLSDGEGLKKTIHALSLNGGFILSTSCGLYSGSFLERIETIYGLIQRGEGSPP